MNKSFRKENIFTCVMFGAIVIFVIVKTLFSSGDLFQISYLIALPILLLSIIKLIVTVLEDVISSETKLLEQTEKYDITHSNDVYSIRGCSADNITSILDNLEFKDERKIIEYKKCYELRKKFRRFRRVLLYCYYAIFMIIFTLLLLHSELSKFNIMSNFDTSILAIWSFVIILIEIMMKDIIRNIIFWFINKKYGVNLGAIWW